MNDILQPKYVQEFHCLASACKDSCCCGWEINSNNKEQDSMGSCSFLTNDKLCALQKKLGENGLSNTCFFFPRCFNILEDKTELSLDLACPFVAQLALSNPDAMELMEAELSTPMKKRLQLSSEALEICNIQVIDLYFYEIRDLIISILKNQKYEIDDKLVIIGRLCSDLDYYKDNNQWNHTIIELLEEYKKCMDVFGFDDYLKIIPKRTDVFLPTVIELLEYKMDGVVESYILNCYSDIKVKLGYSSDCDIDSVVESYSRLQEEFYNEYIKNNQFILVNYFINIIFRELFPFGRKKNMQEQSKKNTMFKMHYQLMYRYALLKFFLVGSFAIHKDKLRLEDFIDTIQSFEKYIGHDGAYLEGILSYFEANKVVTRPFVNMLIKY